MSSKTNPEAVEAMSTEALEEEDLLVSQLNVDISNQYVIFSIGNEEFGIPILSVQEIISIPEITKIPGAPDYIPGIINIRGNVIPLYLLKTRLRIDDENGLDDSVTIIIQLETGKSVGLIVDTVSDVVSIPPENLREKPDISQTVDTQYISNIGHLGNRMIIVIDIANFFSEADIRIIEKTSAVNY